MTAGYMQTNNANTSLIAATQFVIQNINSPYPIISDPFYLIGFKFDSLTNGKITLGVIFLKNKVLCNR